jgi:hypothetical protein
VERLRSAIRDGAGGIARGSVPVPIIDWHENRARERVDPVVIGR